MTLAIGTLLLILSAVGTLAAFGGKTWLDGDAPLLRRITRRGWVSLACLALATTAGLTKAMLDNQGSAETRRQARADRAKLTEQSAELQRTRTLLQQQMTANLLLGLSGQRHITGLKLELPLGGYPGRDATIGQVLFPALPPAYRPLARIKIALNSPSGTAYLQMGYGESVAEDSTDEDGQTTSFVSSQAGVTLFYATGEGTTPASAIIGYGKLAKGEVGAGFGLVLVKQTARLAEIEAFARDHPELTGTLRRTTNGFEMEYRVPASVAERMAFDSRRFQHPTVAATVRAPGEDDPRLSLRAELRCAPSPAPHTPGFHCKTMGAPGVEFIDY